MIKLIVCDVDGTLLNSLNELDYESYNKIYEKMNNGVDFMYASGRDMNMMVKLCEKTQMYGDLILNNGTQYRSYNGDINISYEMNKDSFIKVINILQENHYHISIHTTKGKYILVDFEKYWDWHVQLLKKSRNFTNIEELPDATFFRKDEFLRDCTSVKSIDEIYEQGAKPLKIDARHLYINEVKGTSDLLREIPHLSISSSYEDNIEITSDTYNKGIMLKEVLKNKGLSIDEVATFGDGDNDACMLEDFPYSFAPMNARESAKCAASYKLTKNVCEGAVKEGIEILERLNLI
jgi:Cof subfamily protein (haloacid dehalogenase superfamily)